jgi:hypothetical protein
MPASFWIFKDPSNNRARTVSVDPSTSLPQRQQVDVTVPSGVMLTAIVNQLAGLTKELEGRQGDEAFLKVTISDPPSGSQLLGGRQE